jgi:hypothetical protein
VQLHREGAVQWEEKGGMSNYVEEIERPGFGSRGVRLWSGFESKRG